MVPRTRWLGSAFAAGLGGCLGHARSNGIGTANEPKNFDSKSCTGGMFNGDAALRLKRQEGLVDAFNGPSKGLQAPGRACASRQVAISALKKGRLAADLFASVKTTRLTSEHARAGRNEDPVRCKRQ